MDAPSSPIQRIFKQDNLDKASLISCSFCNQTLEEVGQLFVGEAAASCPECMILAHNVIAEDLAESKK